MGAERARLADGLSSRGAYALAAFLVIAVGLGLRFVPLGLPFLVTKYGGSTLWGAMVYLLVRACRPSARVGSAAVSAIAIAALIELSRLYHTPDLDAFRQTLTGALLLGRVFSAWNILAYATGIGLVVALEGILKPAQARALQLRVPSSPE